MKNLTAFQDSKINILFYLMGWSVSEDRVNCSVVTPNP